MLKLKDVLRDLDVDVSTGVFTAEAMAVVDSMLMERNGKPYLKCQIRGKEVQAKPEEIVRQLWIAMLLNQYQYPRQRVAVEYPITFGRDSSKRADIVVFDEDRATVPYIVVEVKQATQKNGKEQLKSYTHATGAPLALWSNGIEKVIWHRKNPNYFVEIPVLPTANETIDDVAGQPWTVDTLVEKEKEREKLGRALDP